jgi:hypothetical protein
VTSHTFSNRPHDPKFRGHHSIMDTLRDANDVASNQTAVDEVDDFPVRLSPFVA